MDSVRPNGRRIFLLGFSVSALFIGSIISAQQLPPNFQPPHNPNTPNIGEVISGIAEKDQQVAADFEAIAQSTLQLGMAAKQQGQAFPAPPVYDALQAVDEGESINPLHTDWQALREQLESLLEPPPEQEQQQDQQDQNQENQEQDQQNQQGQQGGDQQNQDQNQQPQEQEESSESDQQQQGNQDQQQQNEQSQQGQEQQQEQPSGQQSLGDMEEPEGTPQLDQEQKESQQQETQQVGGTPEQEEPLNARQAMVRQILDQVKKQDDPGTLHMLLQQAEEPEEQPQTPRKDW